MINEELRKRPRVEECLSHPFFWSPEKRLEYLKQIGNQDEVAKFKDADPELISSMERCAEDRSFKEWKNQFPLELVQKLDGKKKTYSDNILGLLRFMRNLLVHYPKEADEVKLKSMFPALFGCVYTCAKSREWNSRPDLKGLFKREEFPGDDMTTTAAVSSTNTDENVKSPIQESQTSTKPTEK
ncbi:serine/threonine-protein kinase/endoribonuclease IRE1b-like isoform X2 [Notolabrus celidotus]|uniref:serine/threonine-protein kinase/endoribonuclease IRE1b-like isoform X2 n=1 Tax=Notolabrus celidotus TaxID=1203425 RepID=UPI00148F8E16|nr:serine/threonine-protein kinase/endoribonuclease IRE1b-like isoform X2 [Notolabrus celidotus]